MTGSVDRITAHPCLVLLGDPGIGKSFAVEQLHGSVATSGASNDGCKLLNLRVYGTDAAICRAIFDATWFREWEDGSHRLHLFLDSLDECRVRVPTVAALLAEELKTRPIGRLSLRIACRSAEWPETFGKALGNLWGDGKVGVFELAPLGRADVETAAAVRGSSPETFLREIVRCGVQSLAARPLTLELLLDLFGEDGRLPERLSHIYERGLKRLCEDSEERRDAGIRPLLSSRQRLAVASRIAAGLVLGNRYAVAMGSDHEESGDVALADLIGGAEGSEHDMVGVGEAELRETLGTGLFVSAGVARRRFAHQTYAEFLAARFLHTHLDGGQRDSLIVVPGEQAFFVAPQLEETVGWLASAEPTVFARLLATQPEVLLRGDVSTADPAARSSIVSALLERLRASAIADWRVLVPYLWKLRHPDLADQLRTLILDRTLDPEVRAAAIVLARECETSSLSDDLASVALDPAEEYQVRVWAAHAVLRIGSSVAKARLRPLALGQAGPDPRDELRGCGIEATWPAALTALDLFRSLVRPQDDHFLGVYRSYLWRAGFLPDLSAEDVPLALQWILTSNIGVDPTDDLRDCAHRILLHAWGLGGNEAISRGLALVCLDRVRRFDDIGFGDRQENAALQANIDADVATRRCVVESIVANANAEEHLASFIFRPPSLLQPADFDWLLGQALSAGAADAAHWRELARLAFNALDAAHLEQVFEAARRSSEVASTFAYWLTPVQLGSPEAQAMRTRYLEEEDWRREREPKPLEPPPAERVQAALARCQSEGPQHWWQLCKELTLEPTSARYEALWEREITASPGWTVADDEARRRIVGVARQCIEDLGAEGRSPTPPSMDEEEYARFRAFQLLMEEDGEFIEGIGVTTWKRWMPGIVGWPIGNERIDDATQRVLMALAYQAAPDRFIELLQETIAAENDTHSHLFILEKLEAFWDERLGAALLSRAQRGDLNASCFGTLLRTLQRHRAISNREVAAMLSTPLASVGTHDREYSIEVACSLLENFDHEVWTAIWPLVNTDPAWGRSVCERICQRAPAFVTSLDEGQLGKLLEWLFREYSPATDPVALGAHYVTSDESIRHWRDGLIERLQERGTPAAVAELGHLSATLAAFPWLHRARLRAETARQRREWVPATPRQILDLAGTKNRRYVADGGQLLDVVLESLARLQLELHGETPTAEFLWDTHARRPKGENSLSNFVKQHLERDLKARQIIVGREVEIRSRTWRDGQAGEEVDLHIDTVSEPGDRVSAIVEVKGCWHRELKKAMRTQLTERYLKRNECRHGLYLVGWFLCDAWDDEDGRKASVPFSVLEDCSAYLEEQARTCTAELDGISEVRLCILDCALR